MATVANTTDVSVTNTTYNGTSGVSINSTAVLIARGPQQGPKWFTPFGLKPLVMYSLLGSTALFVLVLAVTSIMVARKINYILFNIKDKTNRVELKGAAVKQQALKSPTAAQERPSLPDGGEAGVKKQHGDVVASSRKAHTAGGKTSCLCCGGRVAKPGEKQASNAMPGSTDTTRVDKDNRTIPLNVLPYNSYENRSLHSIKENTERENTRNVHTDNTHFVYSNYVNPPRMANEVPPMAGPDEQERRRYYQDSPHPELDEMQNDLLYPRSIPRGDSETPPPQSIPRGDSETPPPQSIPRGDSETPKPQSIPRGDSETPKPQCIPRGDSVSVGTGTSPQSITGAGDISKKPSRSRGNVLSGGVPLLCCHGRCCKDSLDVDDRDLRRRESQDRKSTDDTSIEDEDDLDDDDLEYIDIDIDDAVVDDLEGIDIDKDDAVVDEIEDTAGDDLDDTKADDLQDNVISTGDSPEEDVISDSDSEHSENSNTEEYNWQDVQSDASESSV